MTIAGESIQGDSSNILIDPELTAFYPAQLPFKGTGKSIRK
jgi:hypothetical protein